MRPDLFSGIYAPSKGILLYGPPGTGKTLLAKAIATECKSTFFSISASTLTSKWMGEGEKLMRGLFAMAIEQAPSVIFFDEIDSIMGARGGNEHEASRRMKTEFLVQFDGVNNQTEGKNMLVLAATNRPWDLDEAALRRLTRRVYIPLPDKEARQAIVEGKLKDVAHNVGGDSMAQVMSLTEGYSCADMQAMIKEAAMYPMRELPPDKILNATKDQIRRIEVKDFDKAVKSQPPSVSKQSIMEFTNWRKQLGQA
uniref:AAA+ ATPase domain-containing protein n=1 Tax=Strombidium inclinatum TaxID=197538 RepID=A0A7S3IIN4_9SPIT|mmetsp:Transcript_1863/g.2534  ORF Transcript_1863/g.2534 Transcript_1863/m.2534 type:complete len:254 (+) Transcript_1863:776-1537(+)|eukprot:CAMPEP_0170492122 /NCGR_PEP_ID=MMETSP0208-20121228/11701_1 /TAXON_ID=197538 /ORGANISM="Strombidium inclinatum, Strain S3" /LENGTH=253 /DNA_ID=CAMNT_0010767817 /DNA_START=770 /DNA_END=1531 /DNA_ORIENTATION=+